MCVRVIFHAFKQIKLATQHTVPEVCARREISSKVPKEMAFSTSISWDTLFTAPFFGLYSYIYTYIHVLCV